MGSELLPCPFCGKAVSVEHEVVGGNYGTYDFYSVCCDCTENRYRTEAEAIAAWNRRASPPVPQAVLEAVKILESPAFWSGGIPPHEVSSGHRYAEACQEARERIADWAIANVPGLARKDGS